MVVARYKRDLYMKPYFRHLCHGQPTNVQHTFTSACAGWCCKLPVTVPELDQVHSISSEDAHTPGAPSNEEYIEPGQTPAVLRDPNHEDESIARALSPLQRHFAYKS